MRDFVIWNEPNLNRFWLPQFDRSGDDVAAPAYTSLLAQTYDALKGGLPESGSSAARSPRGASTTRTPIRQTQSPTAVHP